MPADRDQSALPVLLDCGGLVGVARMCPADLQARPGIGIAKAAALLAALELERRAAKAELEQRAHGAQQRHPRGAAADPAARPMPRVPKTSASSGTMPGTAMNIPITEVRIISATTLGLVSSL